MSYNFYNRYQIVKGTHTKSTCKDISFSIARRRENVIGQGKTQGQNIVSVLSEVSTSLAPSDRRLRNHAQSMQAPKRHVGSGLLLVFACNMSGEPPRQTRTQLSSSAYACICIDDGIERVCPIQLPAVQLPADQDLVYFDNMRPNCAADIQAGSRCCFNPSLCYRDLVCRSTQGDCNMYR